MKALQLASGSKFSYFFFPQNYQLDLPSDKWAWVNEAFVQGHCALSDKLHVRCLHEQAWTFSLMLVEPTTDPPQASRCRTLWLFCWIRELKGISGSLHSEGQAHTHIHFHQLWAELWESTKAVLPKAMSRWQQIRTATVAPIKTALTLEGLPLCWK